MPRKGCFDYTDPSNDSTIALAGALPDPEASSSDDTEILGVTHRTAPGSIGGFVKSFIKVKALGSTGPAEFSSDGDNFIWNFTAGGKAVSISGGRQGGKPTTPKATVGGTDATASIKPTATFDVTNSVVILSADLVGLGQAVGAILTRGVQLTKMSESSRWLDFLDNPSDSDTAAGKGDAANYGIGGPDVCFYPLAGSYQVEKIKPTSYGHKIDAGVTFVDSDGAPVTGVSLTFSAPGGKPVNATTDTDGFATALVPQAAKAGTTMLTISYPGDDSVGKTTTAVKVAIVLEKTVLSLSSARAGSARTVTVTLRDADRHPLASQRVSLRVGSFTQVVTTNGRGVATVGNVPPGTNVAASYSGQSGKYSGSTRTITA